MEVTGGQIFLGRTVPAGWHTGGIIVAQKLYIAAKRYPAHLPAGALGIDPAENLPSEADRECLDSHTRPARHGKMPQLVKKDDNCQNKKERDDIAEERPAPSADL